jgi:hypothetical protein
LCVCISPTPPPPRGSQLMFFNGEFMPLRWQRINM